MPELCDCPRHAGGVEKREVRRFDSCLVWAIAILLFPLGLLVFLVPPRSVYICRVCGREVDLALRC